jgi:hypothetical protein
VLPLVHVLIDKGHHEIAMRLTSLEGSVQYAEAAVPFPAEFLEAKPRTVCDPA